jgi:hypothetical protein
VTVSLLDIAQKDAKAKADKSIAVLGKIKDLEAVETYFTRKIFRTLYRSWVMRNYARNASDKECDLALDQAKEDKTDG